MENERENLSVAMADMEQLKNEKEILEQEKRMLEQTLVRPMLTCSECKNS